MFDPGNHPGLTPVTGGVAAARGFRAGGVATGMKASGREDLALVVSDCAAAAAATITTNRVKAAPCLVTAHHVANGSARAVVVNSGNANACTGPNGLRDAETTTEAVASALDVDPADVLVCSTGIIGVPLPLSKLLAGIPAVIADLSSDGGPRAARAILTTDTRTKEVAVRVEDTAGACVIGGMAKGSGMIAPTMATMLAVIATDAPITPAVLRPMVRQVVARTFNRISVDMCPSTNDTVIVLANGREPHPPTLATFREALEAVCAHLARAVVEDGEGTSKVAEIRVTGATREGDALALARAIVSSTLVRAALHGADPNWGRVLAAMGSSGVEFDPERVTVTFGIGGTPGPDGQGASKAITVCRFGVATAFDRGQVAALLAGPAVEVTVDLGLGPAEASFLTADLTPNYVAENAYYTT
ncbi:MAG: bifunctional glutamate N-acetyltransferase/amino-acid acetyltransferase ArgJ [Nitriliruptorales bacterium]